MMKRNQKKITGIFTAVCLLLSLMSLSLTAGASYDTANATRFIFSDDGITAQDGAYTGYKISGCTLSITEAGVYSVSGSCGNGAIIVKKNVTGVTLVLDGLTLGASATAPITCNKGSGVTIAAAAGTVNTLSDDQYNNDDVYTDTTLYPDVENAVMKFKDGSNVTICGTGTINVNANGKNGVKSGYDLYGEDDAGNATDTLLSEASLTIEEVTLNVTCGVNDGIKADKELNIRSGSVTVSAADDGIKCDYDLNIGAQDAMGPAILIRESAEGIEAATLNIYSGEIEVNATDDGINAANSDLTGYDFSYNQYGGNVRVNVTNGDGVDANGKVDLTGGTLEIYAPTQGDGDPIDADGGVTFGGATVLAVGHNAMTQNYSGAFVAFGGGMTGGMPGGMGNMQSAKLAGANDTMVVTDDAGSVLYTATAVRDASYVVFASGSLTSGGSYTLNVNGSAAATATAGSSAGGTGAMGGQQPPAGGMNGGMPGQNGQNGQTGEMPTPPGGSGAQGFGGNGSVPPTPQSSGTGSTGGNDATDDAAGYSIFGGMSLPAWLQSLIQWFTTLFSSMFNHSV